MLVETPLLFYLFIIAGVILINVVIVFDIVVVLDIVGTLYWLTERFN